MSENRIVICMILGWAVLYTLFPCIMGCTGSETISVGFEGF